MMVNSMLIDTYLYDAYCLLGSAICAFVIAILCIKLFNALPAKWFCDYDEEPSEELNKKRLAFRKHGILITLILAFAFICIYYQYAKSFTIIVYCIVAVVLLMIGIADYKYSIIPDQFTFALLLCAVVKIGYDILSKKHINSTDFLSPVYGAVAGALLMLLIGFLGKLRYKKEAMGFGDVKLLGVIGLFTAFPNIFVVFLLTIFLAFFHIIYLFVSRKISKGVYLPLGPYLCLGLFLFLAFNRQINNILGWYMSLMVV